MHAFAADLWAWVLAWRCRFANLACSWRTERCRKHGPQNSSQILHLHRSCPLASTRCPNQLSWSPGLRGNFFWNARSRLAHQLFSGEANCCCCAAAPAAAMSWRRLFFPLANWACPAASSSRRLFVGVVASESRSETAAGRAGRLTSTS